MFDELVQAKAAPKAERHLTEEEEKMQVAVRAFLICQHRFKKLDAHPLNASDSKINLQWWTALEDLYVCDKALWELFVGADRNRNWAYCMLLRIVRLVTGIPIRADA